LSVIVARNSAVGTLPIPALSGSIDAAPKKSSRGRRRKWALALLALLVPVIALASVLGYQRSHPAGSAFRTVRVVRADITERVTATGTLQPVVTSPVGAQVSGIVSKLHVDYNSSVKAGELLVELDPALFRNAVALATAQLASALANLTSAQATALGARSVRDRTLSLERQSLVANADLDASEATFGQTTGLARSSAAQIAQARAQLARARLDLEHSIVIARAHFSPKLGRAMRKAWFSGGGRADAAGPGTGSRSRGRGRARRSRASLPHLPLPEQTPAASACRRRRGR
jgi:HlyD family secretion protein